MRIVKDSGRCSHALVQRVRAVHAVDAEREERDDEEEAENNADDLLYSSNCQLISIESHL